MRFRRVVGVVAPSWSSAALTANNVAGRTLFVRHEESQKNEIQRQVCDDVLYLVLGIESGEKGISFGDAVRQEADTLRRIMFLFLCSHTVLWVFESLTVGVHPFRILTALSGSRTKVLTALSQNKQLHLKKGWPGKCQPYLLFAFTEVEDGNLSSQQKLVQDLLEASNLSGRNVGLCRAKSNCCLAVDSPENEVRSNILGFNAQIEDFSISEWIGAATSLANTLRLTDTGGLVGGLGSGQLGLTGSGNGSKVSINFNSANINSIVNSNVSVANGSSSDRPNPVSSRNHKALGAQICTAIARLESFAKLEEQYSKQLCDKGMPHGLEAYVRGLPQLYNSSVHESHVESALVEFRKFTGLKGILSRRQEKKLVEQCRRIWRGTASLVHPSKSGRDASVAVVAVEKGRRKVGSDRRLCDAKSFSGHPCQLLYRACVSSKSASILDLTKCSSGVKETLACSCGRTLFEREDPFDTYAANVSSVSKPCCAALPSCDLSFEEQKAQLENPPASSGEVTPRAKKRRRGGRRARKSQDQFDGAMSGYCGDVDSVPKELILQALVSDTVILTKEVSFSIPIEEEESTTTVSEVVSPSSAGIRRGRRRKGKTDGVKRIGGSWMLHKLGCFGDYNPSVGIPLGGFPAGYNRLESWPDNPIFVGLEYECLSTGSRQFFAVSSLAAPPPLYSDGGTEQKADVQDRLGQLQTSDGRLWPEFDVDLFLAHDQVVSQLQRIFICVGQLKVNTRVRFQAEVHFEVVSSTDRTKVFTHRPVDLPGNSMVCMCLPHVYMNSGSAPLLQPMPTPGNRFRSIGRLKAGLLQIIS